MYKTITFGKDSLSEICGYITALESFIYRWWSLITMHCYWVCGWLLHFFQLF